MSILRQCINIPFAHAGHRHSAASTHTPANQAFSSIIPVQRSMRVMAQWFGSFHKVREGSSPREYSKSRRFSPSPIHFPFETDPGSNQGMWTAAIIQLSSASGILIPPHAHRNGVLHTELLHILCRVFWVSPLNFTKWQNWLKAIQEPSFSNKHLPYGLRHTGLALLASLWQDLVYPTTTTCAFHDMILQISRIQSSLDFLSVKRIGMLGRQ
jgi:hypothetical protein